MKKQGKMKFNGWLILILLGGGLFFLISKGYLFSSVPYTYNIDTNQDWFGNGTLHFLWNQNRSIFFNIPTTGQYTISFLTWQEAGGPGNAKFNLRLDGAGVLNNTEVAETTTKKTVTFTKQLTVGQHNMTFEFFNDYYIAPGYTQSIIENTYNFTTKGSVYTNIGLSDDNDWNTYGAWSPPSTGSNSNISYFFDLQSIYGSDSDMFSIHTKTDTPGLYIYLYNYGKTPYTMDLINVLGGAYDIYTKNVSVKDYSMLMTFSPYWRNVMIKYVGGYSADTARVDKFYDIALVYYKLTTPMVDRNLLVSNITISDISVCTVTTATCNAQGKKFLAPCSCADCPVYTDPVCNGTLQSGGYDTEGCALPKVCQNENPDKNHCISTSGTWTGSFCNCPTNTTWTSGTGCVKNPPPTEDMIDSFIKFAEENPLIVFGGLVGVLLLVMMMGKK